jgi:hypothetical protein
VRQQSPAETSAVASKDEAILVLLAQLAIVYWRPDFTPGQARQLYAQYLEDLRPYALADINDAITAYRRNGDEKFYPLPGQLRALIETVPSWDVISKHKHISERLEASKAEMAKMVEKFSNTLQLEHAK